eukprot:TRINITY_DN1973_c0_g1_i4.p4 TRINITY_DN1973_c0_g1~~TRINITY_DN1973_c0_g1_i4.p4  ORF type:complete len:137 (-),score=37.76 TRINITY_DN1973_c0_g1_i4:826-1236(-)
MREAEKGYYDRLQTLPCLEERAILKDIDRTFPHLGFFDKAAQGYQILRRILRALAIHLKDVGYSQGINSLAATVYLSLNDEENAFWMMVHVLREEDFSELFAPGMERLSLACYQLDSLVRKHIPRLSHFLVLHPQP